MATTYYIHYHTGVGDSAVTGTLEDAMALADKEAAYTQQPITIEDEDGNEVAKRAWWGYECTEADEVNDPIQFESFGFYGDWTGNGM